MIENYLNVLWQILLELSPALLAGLFLAGLLRVFLPNSLIHAHLSQNTLGSVIRAALIGVPMPLCSCGVVPAAIGLRNQGASKGATTSFLISTPQTGVDSVLVSASFLGWPFAIFKLFAAFFTGILGGGLVNYFVSKKEEKAGKENTDTEQGENFKVVGNRIIAIIRYTVLDLLGAIDLWLIGGILVAALISTLLPVNYFENVTWSQGIGGMILVLLISLPLYVCTTSSVPIAASLIAAGMPAGSALVFLMAGPATNIATMGAIYRALGLPILMWYLGTVIVTSMVLGMGFNFLLDISSIDYIVHNHTTGDWWQIALAIVLLLLLAFLLLRRILQWWSAKTTQSKEEMDVDVTLKVEGMSCQHCVASVKNALQNLDEVEEAQPDLQTGFVYIKGDNLNKTVLSETITQAGYKIIDK